MHALITLPPLSETTQDDLLGGTSSQDTPGTAPRIFGRYEVLGLLGSGGMGYVYKVRDAALDEVVALKALRPERGRVPGLLARFRAEVKLARRVVHPNVVRIYDLGEQEGQTFLTMEYVPGRSLRRVLAEDGPLSPEAALHLARQAVSGVAEAHRAGVLHCDLKPDNLLVAPEGRVVVADFGVARALGPGEGLPLGTPAYAAPEQLLGGELDRRADLYGLGAVLYEALTGLRARQGEFDPRDLAGLLALQPDPGPLMRCGALATVVLRCLAPTPEARFPSAEALLAALDGVSTGAGRLRVGGAPRPIPLAGSPSIAVLPLRNAGAEADAPLAEALSGELIDALAATRALRVRPLSAVLRAGEDDPLEAGRALGVSVVVAGSVALVAGELRLRVRAMTVSDGFQVWASRVTRRAEEALTATDEIARGLAEALAASLPGRASPAVLRPDVIDRYLRGRSEMRTGWDRGTTRAVALFEEALAEGEDSRVLSAFAMALARDTFYDLDGEVSHAAKLARAAAAADRALALDPELADGWAARAHVRLYRGDFPGAAAALKRAIQLWPGHARSQQMYGNLLLEADLPDEAVSHLRAAVALDPESHLARMDLARALALGGDGAALGPLLSGTPGLSGEARLLLASTAARLGLWLPDALPPPEVPDVPVGPHSRAVYDLLHGYLAVRAGKPVSPEQRSRSLTLSQRLHPLLRVLRAQYAAELLSAAGDADGGMLAVTQAVGFGLHDLVWMDRCPPLAALRGGPEWARLRGTVEKRAAATRRALG